MKRRKRLQLWLRDRRRRRAGESERSPAGGGEPSGIRLDIGERTNPEWRYAEKGRAISVVAEPLITPQTGVFTMGSCFAVEIRRALRERGVNVYPKYGEITVDPEREAIGDLPARDNVNHYDTFAIRTEFERALLPGGAGDFPPLPVRPGAKKAMDGAARFQDPYRKDVLAVDEASIARASEKVDACVRDAIHKADVYVITLGLIEAWRDRESGRHVWSEKVRRLVPDPERIEFDLSDFQANHANVHRVCSLLRERFPERRIILTVSPVGLMRTFSGDDIVVANTYSKSVLRAVAGQIVREFDNVLYWPSYELALRMDLYEEDGRHVSPEGIDFIVGNFLKAYARL